MKDQADYSQYRCPFDHLEKECGHKLHGPEGYVDTAGGKSYRVWCPCGFRGPAFYLDPEVLGLRKKEKSNCSCADNQGGPCASCMEERYWL